MKKFIFFFLGLFFAFVAPAQVPGFLGHRLSINTSVHAGPDLFGNDISKSNQEEKSRAFNNRFSFGLDYVLSRKWMASSSFHIQKSATNKLTFDNTVEEKVGKTFGYGITSNGFSLSFSRINTRKNDFIAPVGRYFSFGIMVSNFSLIDVEGHVFAPNTKIASGSVAGLTVGFGRRRVFFKRILFDYGLEIANLFYTHKQLGNEFYSEFITVPQKRIKQISMINFKIGAGYLL